MENVKLLAIVNHMHTFKFCYAECNTCRCKTQPVAFRTDLFKCIKNGHVQLESETKSRYRLSLGITDGQSTCTVTVFGESVAALFGDTASNMKEYITQLEVSLQGLEFSIADVVCNAMVMALVGKPFSFVFRLNAVAVATRGKHNLTLAFVKSQLIDNIVAESIEARPTSENFTVLNGIELMVKSFTTNPCSGTRNYFTHMSGKPSEISRYFLDVEPLSPQLNDITEPLDGSLDVVTWDASADMSDSRDWQCSTELVPNQMDSITSIVNRGDASHYQDPLLASIELKPEDGLHRVGTDCKKKLALDVSNLEKGQSTAKISNQDVESLAATFNAICDISNLGSRRLSISKQLIPKILRQDCNDSPASVRNSSIESTDESKNSLPTTPQLGMRNKETCFGQVLHDLQIFKSKQKFHRKLTSTPVARKRRPRL